MDESVINSKAETKNLIFIFHGYGSNKDDLYPIGERFSEVMPNAEIHLANGMEPCEGLANGYRWFRMDSDDVLDWGNGLESNRKTIMDYVDSVRIDKNLEYKDIIFSGFSQGAMLSLSLGIFYGVKAVISFSGLLLGAEKYLRQSSTKVLLAHGSGDDVVPFYAMDLTKEALNKSGIAVETAVSPGLGHAIDGYLLGRAVDFLKSL